MNSKFIYIIQLILFMASFISCSKEDIDGIEIKEGDKIILNLTLPQSDEITKAGMENGDALLNENRIKTLDVFIYQENGDACLYYKRFSLSSDFDGTSVYSQVLDITQESLAFNVNHSIFVVANYTGAIAIQGISLSALKSLSISSLNSDAKQNYFIMDGLTKMILNDGILVNKQISITLKRAAAKIKVTTSFANGFSLAGGASITKKMIKYATNSSLIANGNAITPALQDMSAFTNQNSGAGNTSSIITYSYANDWNNMLSNETYLIVNIPVTDGLGGTYLQNYYKVPVNYRLLSENDNTSLNDDARKALYKIERNRLYNIALQIDKQGSADPLTAVELTANYTIQDWTTKEILVAVDGINFLYVKDKDIKLPNTSSYTTTFQSSTPDLQIKDITVNDIASENGSNGVTITWTKNAKSGNIIIESTTPTNFVAKVIKFTVYNGGGLTQQVTVSQFPSVYLSANTSANMPGGSDGQTNANMYITTSLVPNFSMMPNPDEFDENFGTGYTHYAPNQALGVTYADYIRANAIMGYPLTDANGNTVDTEENNRRISPRFMLASQYGITSAASYIDSQAKCRSYTEKDATTGQTYTDWRMSTLAELYAIDVLQNVRQSQVKRILEGPYYWSASATQAVNFMDPRVGNSATYNKYNAAVRCVRDVK